MGQEPFSECLLDTSLSALTQTQAQILISRAVPLMPALRMFVSSRPVWSLCSEFQALLLRLNSKTKKLCTVVLAYVFGPQDPSVSLGLECQASLLFTVELLRFLRKGITTEFRDLFSSQ